MTTRQSCCVPYCRRTCKPFHHEWICAIHWRMVSREAKRALRLTWRRARKVVARKPQYREYWTLPPGSPARLSAVAVWRRCEQAFERCKREAIERAVGL